MSEQPSQPNSQPKLASELQGDDASPSASSIVVYKRLLTYVRAHWLSFLVATLGFAVFAASQPALAQVMEYLINAIETNEPSERYRIPLAIVLIYIVRGIGSFVGNYCMARVSLGIVHTLRVELFNSLTSMPSSYFDAQGSGHLISRITFNVNQVTVAATDALKVLIREGLTVIGLLAFLFYKDWRLTMVFLLIAPLIGILVVFVGKRLRKLASRIQVTMGNVTQVCSEMINGYKVMRNFGGERYERERFQQASDMNTLQNMKLATTVAANTPTLQFIVAAALGVLVYLAMTFMDTTNPGAFVTYITAAGLIPKPLRQLSGIVGKIQKGVAAADSIFEQLDAPSEQDTGTYTSERVQGRVNIRQVSYAYAGAGKNVLNDINLNIEPGETVALVGRSGSGKSTLASLIARTYRLQDGEIQLDGHSISDYRLDNLRAQFALVDQNVTLFNDTVARNIAYGTLQNCSEQAIRTAAEAAHAWEFIQALPEGLNTVLDEDGRSLSGGQRQRLAIARALLKDAPVLILDEATSALDAESEQHIQEAMDEVMKERTTLVIAHRLATIEKADKIVVMEDGCIVEQGDHQSLLAKAGVYARLHALQFRDA